MIVKLCIFKTLNFLIQSHYNIIINKSIYFYVKFLEKFLIKFLKTVTVKNRVETKNFCSILKYF